MYIQKTTEVANRQKQQERIEHAQEGECSRPSSSARAKAPEISSKNTWKKKMQKVDIHKCSNKESTLKSEIESEDSDECDDSDVPRDTYGGHNRSADKAIRKKQGY